MIIDVVDLKFKTLQFGKKYEGSRYRRGIQLYNMGYVKVKKVELKENNNYEVEATVKGNYDIYNTTLSISGTLINGISCTCEDYHKGNVCKHIIATSMETIEPHYASTLEGKKKLEEKKKEQERKRQEEIRIRQERERKKREYERKYYSGLSTIEIYRRNSIREGENTLDLQDLYEKMTVAKNVTKEKLATSIKVEYSIEIESSNTLKISFKIGQTRMYVLNNISDFYEAYKNGTVLCYGKQLRFIPKRENFIDDSKKVFDYIIKYAEMIEYNNQFSDYRMSSSFNKAIYVTEENIDEFLNLNKNKEIIVHSYYNGNSQYRLTEEKLDISCIFKKEKVEIPIYTYDSWYYETENIEESEEYVLKLNISDYQILLSNTKIYIFYQNKIYSLEKDENLIKLFKLFERQDIILIPEDKIDDLKRYVLPKIKYIKVEDLPEKIIKEVQVVNKLASKILLDADDSGNILLELKFCYMNYEFNVLESGYKTYVNQNNIIRDIPAEKEVLKRIFMDGFGLVFGKKEFIMKNSDDIYEFLLNKIEGYMNDFEVLATDKFKNKQVRQPKISNIGIRVDNGLLELDISKINIDISEIKDILKDYRIKKKYHKLKNGDFLDLANNEDLNLLDEMATTLDIDYSKISKGLVNLPISRSFYLEKLIGSNKDISISKNENFSEMIDNIGNTEISKDIEIDKDFEIKLRDYQKVGYKWLKTLEMYKFGGILADDMGLGKTLQIIALLKSEINSKNKATSIVVCPSTLVLNWKAEVEKWYNSLKILIIRGTAEERKEKINNYKNYDLIITSYDLLKRDIENYEGKDFKYIIADEAQYIKNASTQNSISLKSLNGEIKFALTGTPIENSIAELWSIFDFIMPGYLYNYNKFKKKFEEPILKFEDKEALIRLKRLISPFVLRRVKKDVLTELPEKNITIMKNEMEIEQEKIYLSYLAQTKKEVAEELNNTGFEKNKFKILMLLTRLRQICCHPSLFIENYRGSSGKLKQCIDLVTDAIEAEHKILIFSSYTSMFEIIEKELNKLNIKYFKLIGDTPVNKRIEMVDEFNNNPSVKVFLISLKAGGTGLNLTSADVVIHYDPWWNVSSENQATDRAYRIGQKNSVQVYKLITSNSIEEKINKMQEKKEKLSKDVLSTKETFINKMSKEEILNLFDM